MAQSTFSNPVSGEEKLHFGLSLASVKYRTQLLAYPYFLLSALLFLLQITFGLIIAAQYVWPTFLINTLPFNIGRETHLNLLIFWLLLGLMGASYYLIPEETESEIYSPRLAYVQLGILVLAALGTFAGFWFFRLSAGKPFTESPMPWPILIALGVVLFLVNTGITILRSRRKTAISIVLFSGMAGMAVLYLINMVFLPNLVVDYYMWWWIIHLWVEGTWELIAAAVTAFLLIKITGVEAKHISRWLYVEVALVLFSGIIGIGHHYYWIGTPSYWLLWGAVFSAFEPLPIVLMTVDALRTLTRKRIWPEYSMPTLYLAGSALGHFFGAGVWGFAQTLPQINQWTHGTQITSSHGHFAFFGAFGMLVLAAVYFMVPRLKGVEGATERKSMWSFRLMVLGMVAMVASFTIAGIVQTYLVRLIGLDFIQVRMGYVSFWIFWVWFFGLVLFTPGVLIYLWDFFGIGKRVHIAELAAA